MGRGESREHEQTTEREEFTPYFQAIRSLEDGSMLAAEVLVRWTPPSDGCVAPVGPGLAERAGVIGPLGRRVLVRAAQILDGWGEAAPPRLHLNLSDQDVRGGGALAAGLWRAVDEVGIHPGRLCLEVGERQARAAKEQVRNLRELGAQVALDRFGAGFASYSLLGQLPLTDLKLHASLVRSVGSSHRSRNVVERIVDLARDLGIRTVAEGVQTAEQARQLRECGCRVGQGRLLGQPLPPEEFQESLLSGAIPPRSSESSG
ncbi:MAG: EAL domain-containing protein [Candidatus Palauibacterales bacterium]|nr:EAL domain-containing protein [Candidatus Palauibacterales bacterium]